MMYFSGVCICCSELVRRPTSPKLGRLAARAHSADDR
jgi:hypothetical protein